MVTNLGIRVPIDFRIGASASMKYFFLRGLFAACRCAILIASFLRLSGEPIYYYPRFTPTDGLGHQVVRDIVQSTDGTVWLATWGGGLSRYDGLHWKTISTADGLSSNMTRVAVFDQQGNLWVGTNKGINRFDGRQWTRFIQENTPTLKSDSVFCILVRKDGVLWFGASDGCIYSYDARKSPGESWQRVAEGGPWDRSPIRSLWETPQGEIWVGISHDGGLFRFSQAGWEKKIDKMRIHASTASKSGDRLWFTGNDCIFRYEKGTMEKIPIDDFHAEEMQSILETDDGSVLLGTSIGILQYREKSWSRISLGSSTSIHPYVEAIRVLKDGSLWFGTRNGVFAKRPSDWFAYPQSPDFQWGFYTSSASATILLHPNGQLHTFSDDRWKLKGTLSPPDHRRVMHLGSDRLSVQDSSSIREYDWESLREISAIPLPGANGDKNIHTRRTSDGRFWYYTNQGLYVWDGSQWILQLSGDHPSLGRSLSYFAETKDGTLWVSHTNGVERFTRNTRSWETVPLPSFQGRRINAIQMAKNGSVWFATSGSGVFVLDKGKTTIYSMQNGLSGDWINSLHEDSQGTMWLGMNDSTVTSFRDGQWIHFSEMEKSLGGVVQAAGEDREGALWFQVKPSGLIRYKPSREPPETEIANYPAASIVPYGTALLSFRGWDSWQKSKDADLSYSWRLLHGRERWEIVPWTPYRTQNVISTPALPPGIYTFEVRAADKDRNVDRTPAFISLTVEPYFFMKPWFWIPVSFFLLLAAVSLGMMWREHRNLRESEHWLSEAQHIAHIGHWIYYRNEATFHWSKEVFHIFGITKYEPRVPLPVFQSYVHPEDYERIFQTVRSAFLHPSPVEVEFRIIRPDGVCRHVQVRVDFDVKPEGAIYRMMGTIQDITPLRITQEALQAAKEKAEQAALAKSEFLANMSHEIRTPMNAVVGMTELALQSDMDDKLRDYLEKIQISSQILMGIINDILDFSKIEAGKLSLEKISFRLSDILSQLTHFVGIRAEQKGLELLFDISPDTPDGLIGDPLRFGQILLNLVSNAIKFTEKGEIVVRIRPQSQPSKGRIHLQVGVQDTGIGIPAETISKLFQSFTQADGTTTRKYGGTGLGLSITKSLVEMFGGTIDVESRPGEGSLFTCLIPLGVEEESGTSIDDGTAFTGNEIRALVVDDNPVARQILISILKDLSLDVSSAVSGEEALQRLITGYSEGHPFHIVLMDWKMDGWNGIDTVKRIEQSGIDTVPAVLMISAYSREDIIRKAESVGIRSFLTKPVLKSTLMYTIRKVLKKDADTSRIPPGSSGDRITAVRDLFGTRILLVEDNHFNQQVAMEILEKFGLTVTLAENGKEAVDLVLRKGTLAWDAILMDIQMPEMDGYQATRVIRQLEAKEERPGAYPTIPILAMTAHVLAEEHERCLAAGMNDHISKPFHSSDLLETLRRWVRVPESASISREAVSAGHSRSAASGADGMEPEMDLPGFQVARAIRQIGGDAALYRKMLHLFSEDYRDIRQTLRQKKKEGDTAELRRLVHNLKGLAGNLGAERLARVAADLESGWNQKSSMDEDSFESFLRCLQETLDTVRLWVYKASEKESLTATDQDHKPAREKSADRSQLPHYLSRLKEQLQMGHFQALDIIRKIQSLMTEEEFDADWQQLLLQIENYDYDDASDLLSVIERRFPSAPGSDGSGVTSGGI